jgi:hypothetical protein
MLPPVIAPRAAPAPAPMAPPLSVRCSVESIPEQAVSPMASTPTHAIARGAIPVSIAVARNDNRKKRDLGSVPWIAVSRETSGA